MAKNTDKVTLGVGDLYLNNVDVGHLKGNVELVYSTENVPFKPANMMSAVKLFLTGETCTLKASMAELKVANLRLAMGMNTSPTSNTSFPAYDPSSFEPAAGSSYDVIHFGGEKTQYEYPLRFEHTRDDGTKIIVVLYKARSLSGLNCPFNETDVNIQDVTFQGMADATRAAGDQIGFIAEQVQS